MAWSDESSAKQGRELRQQGSSGRKSESRSMPASSLSTGHGHNAYRRRKIQTRSGSQSSSEPRSFPSPAPAPLPEPAPAPASLPAAAALSCLTRLHILVPWRASARVLRGSSVRPCLQGPEDSPDLPQVHETIRGVQRHIDHRPRLDEADLLVQIIENASSELKHVHGGDVVRARLELVRVQLNHHEHLCESQQRQTTRSLTNTPKLTRSVDEANGAASRVILGARHRRDPHLVVVRLRTHTHEYTAENSCKHLVFGFVDSVADPFVGADASACDHRTLGAVQPSKLCSSLHKSTSRNKAEQL